MTEYTAVALTTFFATIGPIDVATMFAAFTVATPRRERRRIAVKACLIALAILITFALIGRFMLDSLGISLAALRAAGGILLLLIGIDMVFARHSGATTTTTDETDEAIEKHDVAVFPLATPLIAGPGAIGATLLLMAEAHGDLLHQAIILSSLTVIVGLTLISMLMAGEINRFLGVTGMQVITRIFGIILSALAVQFLFDGIAQSHIFGGG
ncbi:MAG TPA: antibiotic resistance protein MarC [Spongiibacteraceae bacterium]|nr:antibiotic resistance protein MarC [Spongiibacteraceae bacterium]MBN51838.1 antibiotic resistance protein MarC [Spongiibacteraceae bacterium]HCS26386.1 antibiotic resistance protein MarC [Spongiibacteraceae bacterium]|tara:strand:- start:1884 stop:2519 length:636 start_codon:yes stop_codon:yes gene_type:complete